MGENGFSKPGKNGFYATLRYEAHDKEDDVSSFRVRLYKSGKPHS
jgi:hypothetical protein